MDEWRENQRSEGQLFSQPKGTGQFVMTRTDVALGKLIYSLFNHLRRLLAPEYFIEYICSFHTSKIWKLFLLRGQLKCGGTQAETRFRLSSKRTSPFKSVGGGAQFSRLLAAEVCASAFIVGSSAGYTMFRGSVKGTGYPLHSRFPFTSPPLRHRVPSYFSWTLSHLIEIMICQYDYKDRWQKLRTCQRSPLLIVRGDDTNKQNRFVLQN